MARQRRSMLSPEELAQHELHDEMRTAIAEIAAELGPAPGASEASPKDKVRLWGIRDEKVDPEQMTQRLMTQGYPPELLDPSSDTALMVVRENPDLAEAYGQPTPDPATADLLTRFAEWPFRWGLLRHLADDPEAMVKESDRLDAAWQKTQPPVPLMMQEPPAGAPMMPPSAATPDMSQGMPQSGAMPAMPMPQQPPQQAAPQMPADMMGMLGG